METLCRLSYRGGADEGTRPGPSPGNRRSRRLRAGPLGVSPPDGFARPDPFPLLSSHLPSPPLRRVRTPRLAPRAEFAPPERRPRRVRTPRREVAPATCDLARRRANSAERSGPTCELGGSAGLASGHDDVAPHAGSSPPSRTPRWLVATESHLPSADPAEFAPPVARAHLRCATSETGVRTRQPEPDPGANSAARAGPRCELGDGGEVLGRRDVVAARPRRAPNDRGPVPRGGRGRSHGGG